MRSQEGNDEGPPYQRRRSRVEHAKERPRRDGGGHGPEEIDGPATHTVRKCAQERNDRQLEGCGNQDPVEHDALTDMNMLSGIDQREDSVDVEGSVLGKA